MGYIRRLDKSFEHVPVLPLNEITKYVIMSDCHRGVGNTTDTFLKNEIIFYSALQSYYKEGFHYIELGDGDELWKNRNPTAIFDAYEDIFNLIKMFRKEKRLSLLFGNHDLEKSCKHYNDGFTYHEGLLLNDILSGNVIHITHGHQADIFNSTMWRISRFLVRYIWKPLEMYGIANPISAANNYEVKEKTEKRLSQWAIRRNTALICGHTHRAVMGSRLLPYFNSGCCIYPGSITALEIKNRRIQLVKWKYKTCEDFKICISREILSDGISIDDVFSK